MHRRNDHADAFAYMAEHLRRQRDEEIKARFSGKSWGLGEEPAPRPAPAPSKSRFDGPNVIDLVRGADGTYAVPEARLSDVRAL